MKASIPGTHSKVAIPLSLQLKHQVSCDIHVLSKVVQAHFTKMPWGKFDFTKIGQTFIDVHESTANVDYITSIVQRKWGQGHILVTGDGLPIEESSSTQGILCTHTVIITL